VGAALPAGLAASLAAYGVQQLRRRGRGTARLASPYPGGVYDQETAGAYFQSRPWLVAWRGLDLLVTGLSFGGKLLLDSKTGQWEANVDVRAKELTETIISLGPTFIKIGQALSIRADLLPPAYLVALTELQDRVPPFPTGEADELIESQLKQPVGELFEEISPLPIASASLGQVYKAKLRDGPYVAVKVQRPGMEEVVALDLYLLKLGAGPARQLLSGSQSGLNSDLAGLIDEWGKGFVEELDYRKEAKNAQQFQAAIERTPLAGAVFAPTVVESCSSQKVLTTEWVDGERLEQSQAEDVTKLCSVAMNTYLTMLLETGTLHADPHPGNLLRTSDGRLCILDWGLVTSLDTSFRVAYIEHIAHLVSADYGPVPRDLVKLGFVPEEMEADIEKSEVVALLSNIYGQWSGGGGAAKIDVNRVFSEIQDLSRQYGNLFRVPPYFFYIARAFAVLEGIGLSNDSGYSVVSECLPYVAQRLMTDQDPRIAGALASFVYGSEKDRPDRQFDTKRMKYLAEGFTSYTASTKVAGERRPVAQEAGAIAEQLAKLILGPAPEASSSDAGEAGHHESGPSPLQELVLDELAKVVGANARRTASSLGLPWTRSGGAKLLTLDDTDIKVLAAAEEMASFGQPRVTELLENFRALPFDEQRSVALEVGSKLWNYRGGAFSAANRLVAKLLVQGISRVRSDLDRPFR